MMNLLLVLYLATIPAASTGHESEVQRAAPTTIAIVSLDCMRENHVNGEWAPILKPVAVYRSGTWLSSDIFSMLIPGTEWEYAEIFTSEQDALLDSILGVTFYSCEDPRIHFITSKKTRAQICDDLHIGMQGTLHGKVISENEFPTIAMINNRDALGTMRPGSLSAKDRLLLEESMPKRMGAFMKRAVEENPAIAKEPLFNSGLYRPPVYDSVIECSLPNGWKCFWIQTTMSYPPESSPPPNDASIGDSGWSGRYFALLDPKREPKNRILWEYAVIPGLLWESELHLMAVTDLDKDRKPEFLINESKHEYGGYSLRRFKDGELVEISAISGCI